MGKKNITYQEVKEREYKVTQNYTEKDFDRYYKLLVLAKKYVFNVKTLWVLSMIPFFIFPGLFYWIGGLKFHLGDVVVYLIAHMLYWRFVGKKSTDELIDEVMPELNMVIDALDEIKVERLKK